MKLELKKLISSFLFGELIRSEEPGFKNRIDYLEWYEKLRNNYDDFLKQQLAIWMFIPCKLVNGVWLVLEEKSIFNTTDDEYIFDSESFDQYQEAKDRVLFEGFKVYSEKLSSHLCQKIRSENITIAYYNHVSLWKFENKFYRIEDLVKYNLELTPTAEKQIGINH